MFKTIYHNIMLRRLPEPIRARIIAIMHNHMVFERRDMAVQLIQDLLDMNMHEDVEELLHKTFKVLTKVCPDVRKTLIERYAMFDYNHEIVRRRVDNHMHFGVKSKHDDVRDSSNPIFYDCNMF